MRNLLSDDEWLVTESGFDFERANVFETLFTVGNGYLGTRGTLEEGHQGQLSGTYLNGVYDSHDSPVIDLVNAPDWLSFAVLVGGIRLDVQSCRVLAHERAIDLRHGQLWRRTIFEDAQGRRTRLETLRFASLQDRRLCALRVEITPENHRSLITVESGLDGRRRNLDRIPVYPPDSRFDHEVKWEKWARTKHLQEVAKVGDDEVTYLEMQTIDTGITIGMGATLMTSEPSVRRSIRRSYEQISEHLDFIVAGGETLRIDKMVSVTTSRDAVSVSSHCLDALDSSRRRGFDDCIAQHRAAWESLWADCDCEIIGDDNATKAVRFGIYQLLIAANGDDPTVNIGAKSLTGEGYRGHVFWDTEVLMLPFFIYTQPKTARALLQYRYHTLPGARELATETGTRGARFPWESADTGREECPRWTPDGLNRFWTRDEEIHVSADVAYGISTYVAATGDIQLLLDFGAEILFETSRFWIDRVEFDATTDSFSIKQVMGPDEFHSHTDNNAFTNRMAQWHLTQSAQVYEQLSRDHPDALADIVHRIGLVPVEVETWRAAAERISFPHDFDSGLIEQFDGYFRLSDVPITEWDSNDMPRYPDGYHHFNCEDTMLLKQPDVVMLMYMLPDEFSMEVKRANFEFYEARTLHKSSLSPAIHAIMGIEVGDSHRALQYFNRSAYVDLADNQGNTQEGIHIASAGGTWQVLVCGFGGFRVRRGMMTFNPWLPAQWREIRFRLRWRGHSLAVVIDHDNATFCLDAPPGTTEELFVRGTRVTVTANQPAVVELSRTVATEWVAN